VGGTTAIAAASFGAVAGGTVTSGWLSPAAACLLRECVQNAARSSLRALIILKHLLLKKALSSVDGLVRRRPVCGGAGGISAAASAAGSALIGAPSPLCLPGAHSTLPMAGSYLRSPPLFVGCAPPRQAAAAPVEGSAHRRHRMPRARFAALLLF